MCVKHNNKCFRTDQTLFVPTVGYVSADSIPSIFFSIFNQLWEEEFLKKTAHLLVQHGILGGTTSAHSKMP